MATTSERRKRTAAVVFGFIECVILAGALYGWVPTVFILKDAGVFSHLCDVDKNATNATSDVVTYPTCPAQDDVMTLDFTIANFMMQGSTLITGAIFDKFGLRITRLGGGLVYVAGCVMMAFASVDLPALIFPGLICLGIGGIQLLVTNTQIGNYFTRMRLPVVTIFSAAFDTSSATPFFFKLINERGVRHVYLFLGLAVFAIISISISTLLLLPKFKIIPRDQVRSKARRVKVKDGEVEMRAENEAQAEPLDAGSDGVKIRSLRSCVFSITYLLAMLWHGLLQLRFYVYIGTLNVWLQIITDNDIQQISVFTNVFSAMLMCGIVMGPLEGLILAMEEKRLVKDNKNLTYFERLRPTAVPEFLCCMFGLLLSVFNLFNISEFLYLQFIFVAAMRGFLYGLNAAFLFVAFPAEHFGKLYGILMTINSAVSCAQYGLFKWAEGPPRDFFPVNVMLLIVVLVSFVQPFYLWFGDKITCIKRREDPDNE